jgi:hypothetical protein
MVRFSRFFSAAGFVSFAGCVSFDDFCSGDF